MSLPAALEKLLTLDDPIGRNWFKHARAAGAADDLLNVVIAMAASPPRSTAGSTPRR